VLRQLTATRYLQPLREGGSLPAVVETDGGELFVVKFRGAGQGPKALIAELVVGELARAVGLPVPELVLVQVLPSFGRSEPDPEIQEILTRSHGVNVGLRYLDGALNFDASAAGEFVDDDLASRLVWFDAFITNPDRTHRNPNLLIWQRRPWLIDHGAALYAHHDWAAIDEARTRSAFPLVKDHVMLARAGGLRAVDSAMRAAIEPEVLRKVLDAVPDALLMDDERGAEFATADAARGRYVRYLTARLAASGAFVDEAEAARARARQSPPRRVSARR
jgi:hypothetical protein